MTEPRTPLTEPRVIFVSGGGTGIGRAVAADFAAGGDRVTIFGRRADVLARAADALPGDVRWHAGDLADPAQAGDAVRAALEPSGGRVDVVVAAAGGVGGSGGSSLAEVAARWDSMMRVNVLTAVLLTEATRTHLTRPGGRVVLVSSIAALRPGGGAYGAAKAALHAYCYNLAADLGPDGITANVVAPGYVEDTEFFGDAMSEQRRATLIGQTLNGRPGHPRDVAGAVRWLAAPESGT